MDNYHNNTGGFCQSDSVAAQIMAKYGYRAGQGLGKSEQGMTTALRVEKSKGGRGKIIHEKDNPGRACTNCSATALQFQDEKTYLAHTYGLDHLLGVLRLRGNERFTRLLKVGSDQKLKNGQVACEVCPAFSTSSEVAIMAHLQSRPHLRLLCERLEAVYYLESYSFLASTLGSFEEPSVAYYCECCDFRIPHGIPESAFREHLATFRHVRNFCLHQWDDESMEVVRSKMIELDEIALATGEVEIPAPSEPENPPSVYPPPRLMGTGPKRCRTCTIQGLTFQSEALYAKHMEGFEHTLMLLRVDQENNVLRMLSSICEDIPNWETGTFSCEVCPEYSTKYEPKAKDHYETNGRHYIHLQKKLKQLHFHDAFTKLGEVIGQAREYPSSYFCLCCHAEIGDLLGWNNHIMKKKHFTNFISHPWEMGHIEIMRRKMLHRLQETLTRHPVPKFDKGKFRSLFNHRRDEPAISTGYVDPIVISNVFHSETRMIRQLCDEHGAIDRMDHDNQRVIVHYQEQGSANSALVYLDGATFLNRKLDVSRLLDPTTAYPCPESALTLFVGGVAIRRRTELIEMCDGYGKVSRVTHGGDLFCYVKFADPSGAALAQENLNGLQFYDRTLKVEHYLAKNKRKQAQNLPAAAAGSVSAAKKTKMETPHENMYNDMSQPHMPNQMPPSHTGQMWPSNIPNHPQPSRMGASNLPNQPPPSRMWPPNMGNEVPPPRMGPPDMSIPPPPSRMWPTNNAHRMPPPRMGPPNMPNQMPPPDMGQMWPSNMSSQTPPPRMGAPNMANNTPPARMGPPNMANQMPSSMGSINQSNVSNRNNQFNQFSKPEMSGNMYGSSFFDGAPQNKMAAAVPGYEGGAVPLLLQRISLAAQPQIVKHIEDTYGAVGHVERDRENLIVHFQQQKDAYAFLGTANGTTVHGVKTIISQRFPGHSGEANPNAVLTAGCIAPQHIPEFLELCQAYGPVLTIEKGLFNTCFVKFVETEDAETALKGLNGQRFLKSTNTLKVKRYASKTDTQTKEGKSKSISTGCLHVVLVSNLPHQVDQEDLVYRFKKIAPVINFSWRYKNHSRGALLSFGTRQEAKEVILKLHKINFMGYKLNVELSKSSEFDSTAPMPLEQATPPITNPAVNHPPYPGPGHAPGPAAAYNSMPLFPASQGSGAGEWGSFPLGLSSHGNVPGHGTSVSHNSSAGTWPPQSPYAASYQSMEREPADWISVNDGSKAGSSVMGERTAGRVNENSRLAGRDRDTRQEPSRDSRSSTSRDSGKTPQEGSTPPTGQSGNQASGKTASTVLTPEDKAKVLLKDVEDSQETALLEILRKIGQLKHHQFLPGRKGVLLTYASEKAAFRAVFQMKDERLEGRSLQAVHFTHLGLESQADVLASIGDPRATVILKTKAKPTVKKPMTLYVSNLPVMCSRYKLRPILAKHGRPDFEIYKTLGIATVDYPLGVDAELVAKELSGTMCDEELLKVMVDRPRKPRYSPGERDEMIDQALVFSIKAHLKCQKQWYPLMKLTSLTDAERVIAKNLRRDSSINEGDILVRAVQTLAEMDPVYMSLASQQDDYPRNNTITELARGNFTALDRVDLDILQAIVNGDASTLATVDIQLLDILSDIEVSIVKDAIKRKMERTFKKEPPKATTVKERVSRRESTVSEQRGRRAAGKDGDSRRDSSVTSKKAKSQLPKASVDDGPSQKDYTSIGKVVKTEQPKPTVIDGKLQKALTVTETNTKSPIPKASVNDSVSAVKSSTIVGNSVKGHPSKPPAKSPIPKASVNDSVSAVDSSTIAGSSVKVDASKAPVIENVSTVVSSTVTKDSVEGSLPKASVNNSDSVKDTTAKGSGAKSHLPEASVNVSDTVVDTSEKGIGAKSQLAKASVNVSNSAVDSTVKGSKVKGQLSNASNINKDSQKDFTKTEKGAKSANIDGDSQKDFTEKEKGTKSDPSPVTGSNNDDDTEDDSYDDLVREIANGNLLSLRLLHPMILKAVLNSDRETLDTVDVTLVKVLMSLDRVVVQTALDELLSDEPMETSRESGNKEDEEVDIVKEIARGKLGYLERLHPLILKATLEHDEETLDTVDPALVEVLKSLDPHILETAHHGILMNLREGGGECEGGDHDVDLVHEIITGNMDSLQLLHPQILAAVLADDQETLQTVDESLVHVLQRLDHETLRQALNNINVKLADKCDNDNTESEIKVEKICRELACGNTDSLRLLHAHTLQAAILADNEALSIVDQRLVEALRSVSVQILQSALDAIQWDQSKITPLTVRNDITVDLVDEITKGHTQYLQMLNPKVLKAVLNEEEETLNTLYPKLVAALRALDVDVLMKVYLELDMKRYKREEARRSFRKVTPHLLRSLRTCNWQALYQIDLVLIEAFINGDQNILSELSPQFLDCLHKYPLHVLQEVCRVKTRQQAKRFSNN